MGAPHVTDDAVQNVGVREKIAFAFINNGNNLFFFRFYRFSSTSNISLLSWFLDLTFCSSFLDSSYQILIFSILSVLLILSLNLMQVVWVQIWSLSLLFLILLYFFFFRMNTHNICFNLFPMIVSFYSGH